MFGYVRPLKDELKVREFEQYRACYCALCHTLKARYGALARNILTYDFTFLAMLLWEAESEPDYGCTRCLASPLKKIKTCAPTKALELCAGFSVILAYWKLRDSVSDERFLKSLRDRALLFILSPAYRKASGEYPALAETVRLNLEALRRLELPGGAPAGESPSLDEYADKFARVTEALAPYREGDAGYRPLRQLLYHAGRVIYLLDACDDLGEDLKRGRFNPLAQRFVVREGRLSEEDMGLLRATILHSCGLIGAAYELLPRNTWSPITGNIVYIGMPHICHQVLDGTWKSREGARK